MSNLPGVSRVFRRRRRTDSVACKELLAEARDLLVHSGRHTRWPDEAEFPPCPGCGLEARIDAALADD